uniref:outer membrane protein n=1 Tax=Orrella sp. TaxID=1921583 RepID=UPI004048A644
MATPCLTKRYLMKIKILVAAIATAGLTMSGAAMAQSAFEGFYGQVSTGFESNTVDSAQDTGQDNNGVANLSNIASPSVNSAPLVLGLGYTFLVKDKFTLGLGVDYSALTQTTNTVGFYYPGTGSTNVYNYNFTVSNRFSLFVTPGYAIDRDKLAYVKLGYTNQRIKYSQTNCCSAPSNTDNVNGYVLGLGYKQILTQGLYAFVEANYYAYEKSRLSSTYADGPGGTVSASPSSSAYNFLVGVGYKF